MIPAVERLLSIRVADVMSRDVVSVSASATMAEAAELYRQHRISGSPVVNEAGHCVGILSATDLVNAQYQPCGEEVLSPPGDEFELVDSGGQGPFYIDRKGDDRVRDYMSCAPQTIAAQQSLIDAARYMDGQHIHRLVVLDEHAHPIGVISSLDIVSALVKTVDEHASLK